ncbi:MAG: DUF4105 domain-containing protein [Prevotella sp.]|nr:DUF4105 domain-containing protein [Prevotella sp.]
MKKRVLYIIIMCLLPIIQITVEAQSVSHNTDSIQISLLTCSPGKEIWAQYGHTAIRYKDEKAGQDIAINYGLFSSDQPFFILRFIFGLTDYRVGAEPMDMFIAQYSYEGRGVIEQVLNISPRDKELIRRALEENLKPENQVYRYNFFYDNCTTRARNIIVDHLHGKIIYPIIKNQNETFRSLIHEWNKNYEWSQFGEDLLLGINADKKVSQSEQQFLPDNLRRDFAKATYNGKPLVIETHELLAPQTSVIESEFPLSPLEVACIFVIICTIMMVISNYKKKMYWVWDTILMLAAGLLGIIYFVMIFSQHPCVSLNAIIFFFNPLPLFFLYKTIKKTKRQESNIWWKIWGVLIILGFIGAFFQHIPTAILIMALFLLLHCILHIRLDKSVKKINRNE